MTIFYIQKTYILVWETEKQTIKSIQKRFQNKQQGKKALFFIKGSLNLWNLLVCRDFKDKERLSE